MRFMSTYTENIWRNYNFQKGDKFSAHLNIFLVSPNAFPINQLFGFMHVIQKTIILEIARPKVLCSDGVIEIIQ